MFGYQIQLDFAKMFLMNVKVRRRWWRTVVLSLSSSRADKIINELAIVKIWTLLTERRAQNLCLEENFKNYLHPAYLIVLNSYCLTSRANNNLHVCKIIKLNTWSVSSQAWTAQLQGVMWSGIGVTFYIAGARKVFVKGSLDSI